MTTAPPRVAGAAFSSGRALSLWSRSSLRVLAGLACVGYLILVALANPPGRRRALLEAAHVEHDSEYLRRAPASVVRFYAAFYGDPYVYFVIGSHTTGRRLPTDTWWARQLGICDKDEPGCRIDRPELPYRDFACQYPPLAVLHFAALAAVAPSFDVFWVLLRLLNLAALAGVVLASYGTIRRAGVRVAPMQFLVPAVLFVAAIGPRWLCMYDALPALAVALTMYCLASEREALPGWAGAACAAGTMLKAYPAFIAPLALLYAFRSGGRRGALRFVLGGLACALVVLSPWLVLAPSHALDGFVAQAGRRYLEVGSVGGNLLAVLRRMGPVSYEDADELGSSVLRSPLSRDVLGLLKVALSLFAAGLFALFAWRTRPASPAVNDPERRLYELSMCILAFHTGLLFLAPIFSPQYTVWLLPAVLPLALRSRDIVLFACLSAFWMQVRAPLLDRKPGPALFVMLIRDVAMLQLGMAIIREWRSPTREPENGPNLGLADTSTART